MSRATFAPESGLNGVSAAGCVVVMMGASAPEKLVSEAWRVDRRRFLSRPHTRERDRARRLIVCGPYACACEVRSPTVRGP